MRLLSFTLTVLICSTALAAESDKATVKKIDRRNASSENRYFLVFCARGGSLTGHAFVVVGKEDAQAQRSTQDAFGLYPKSGVGVLGTVPGEIVNEATKGSLAKVTDRLIVEVSVGHHERTEKIRRKWVDKGEYRLVLEDCVSFVEEIAKSIGLRTPSRLGPDGKGLMPQAFIRNLIKLND